MGYRALGSFFAQRGFTTVIPDYRLVPEVKFPDASKDIRDAIVWVSQNTAAIATAASSASSSTLEPDPGYMFVMGHSAGTAHTMVMSMHKEFRGTVPPLRGLLSGRGWGEGPVKFYFGTEKVQREREPCAPWKGLADEGMR
ncbi:hypothetical protein PAXINDRAFT_119886 [Paxillus involutus ATCC 200175]|uniref:Alpha/beta hydrolase fold-3 domain-containing protein n=1 Tax=Paxillus involutus ATCC 200175 TaxID=664439 RepID=A0A0C9SQE9_PAXIN|nr:hypothetical protein PAXINDRAFT_119886 [Paxillus involutus ATCC 200175]